jgi:hypothetical protein
MKVRSSIVTPLAAAVGPSLPVPFFLFLPTLFFCSVVGYWGGVGGRDNEACDVAGTRAAFIAEA